jgi:predicted nucleotidyltransferase/HEPN domain-containing protein
MKKSLPHLPQLKQSELELIAFKIRALCDDVQMVILFGSYARGDFKDGPHEQGRGRLIIHKRSDYDILVLVKHEYTALDISLWDKVKEKLAQSNLSTHVRIIPRDFKFVNFKLSQGQYFFTEICEQGIILYDSGRFKLNKKQKLDPAEEKQIAQANFDEAFHSAKAFYNSSQHNMEVQEYKLAAFELHQAAEFASKTVLLIFGSECPQEHHLDILGKLAADYCPQLKGILPRETDEQKKLFELLDYAYIGARYDINYKITKEQLEQLDEEVLSDISNSDSLPYDTDITYGSEYSTEKLRFMTYLRHNGFPSPLLDWTRSPYIAAFFAFNDLWTEIKPEYVSIFAYQEYTGLGKGRIWGEPYIHTIGSNIDTDKKHYLQQSEYSICAIKENKSGKKYFASYEDVEKTGLPDERQDTLIKFNIPASEQYKVLGKLGLMNINAYSLFTSELSLIETLSVREFFLPNQ